MELGEWYTPHELDNLPTLATGQADDLVGENERGDVRVWTGRTEDSPAVSIETLKNGSWVTVWEGYPSHVRFNWQDDWEVMLCGHTREST